MTFKRILVATDFSESAENAVAIAAELALQFDAELTLLTVWEIPPVSYGATLYVPSDLAGPILLVWRLHEATELHSTLESLDIDFHGAQVFMNQKIGLHARGDARIVQVLARAFAHRCRRTADQCCGQQARRPTAKPERKVVNHSRSLFGSGKGA